MEQVQARQEPRRQCLARPLGVLILAVIASMAIPAASLASPTGSLTRTTATSDWTHGSIAGSVTWSDCTLKTNANGSLRSLLSPPYRNIVARAKMRSA